MSAIILSNSLLTMCGRGSALSVYRALITFGRASWKYFAIRFDSHPNEISLVININNLLVPNASSEKTICAAGDVFHSYWFVREGRT